MASTMPPNLGDTGGSSVNNQESMLPPPPPLYRIPAVPQPMAPAPPASGKSPSDPVLGFVGDMMKLMTNFASSYQSSINQPQSNQGAPLQPLTQPSSLQEAPLSETSQQNQPLTQPPSLQVAPLPETSHQSIQPTTEWLRNTQEDLAQQLDALDDYHTSGEMEDDDEGDDERFNPFAPTNMSENSDSLSTVPRAWISHQISSQLNELSDELFNRVTTAEKTLGNAIELINTQNNKIMLQETKITDILTANDALKKDVGDLNQQVHDLKNHSCNQPASRKINSQSYPSATDSSQESTNQQ